MGGLRQGRRRPVLWPGQISQYLRELGVRLLQPEQLEKAGAYRTDLDPDDEALLFPDGGTVEDIVGVYETELEAMLEPEEGDPQYREE